MHTLAYLCIKRETQRIPAPGPLHVNGFGAINILRSRQKFANKLFIYENIQTRPTSYFYLNVAFNVCNVSIYLTAMVIVLL